MNASADTVYGYPAATPKLHPCSRHLSFSCPWNRIRCGDGRVTSQVGAQGAREHLKHTHVIRKDILISSCTGTYVPPLSMTFRGSVALSQRASLPRLKAAK